MELLTIINHYWYPYWFPQIKTLKNIPKWCSFDKKRSFWDDSNSFISDNVEIQVVELSRSLHGSGMCSLSVLFVDASISTEIQNLKEDFCFGGVNINGPGLTMLSSFGNRNVSCCPRNVISGVQTETIQSHWWVTSNSRKTTARGTCARAELYIKGGTTARNHAKQMWMSYSLANLAIEKLRLFMIPMMDQDLMNFINWINN